ncbi:hypothetical protein ACFX2C_007678 [Malus domestica]
MDSKIKATSDVAQVRRSAILYAASISNRVATLIDGAADPAPEQGEKQLWRSNRKVVLGDGLASQQI